MTIEYNSYISMTDLGQLLVLIGSHENFISLEVKTPTSTATFNSGRQKDE